MKRNNKGYSLVELIVTMAIFSIVMLAIIMIMRTTVSSYKEGLFEASMQEEAQIVANQVADALVDCTAYTSSGATAGGMEYKFSGIEVIPGSYESIELSSLGNKLYYNSHVLSDQLATDGFHIYGLNTRDDTSAVYDNIATVEIKIENDGREYTATKDVYFRNQVEYQDTTTTPDPFDVSGAPAKTTGLGSGEKVATVLRYRPYDISENFDIVSNVTLSTKAAELFSFYDKDGNVVTNVNSCSANDYISGEANKHVIIGVTSLGKDSFHKNSSSFQNECYMEGNTSTGDHIKVYLKLDAVELDNGAGVYVMKGGGTAPDGYPTHINVTGIDINRAINKGLKVEYSATFSSGPDMPKTELKHVNKEYVNGDYINNTLGLSDKVPLTVCPEPIEGGLVITAKNGWNIANYNNSYSGIPYKDLNDETKINTTQISIYFGGDTTPYDTLDYDMKFSGQSLENLN